LWRTALKAALDQHTGQNCIHSGTLSNDVHRGVALYQLIQGGPKKVSHNTLVHIFAKY